MKRTLLRIFKNWGRGAVARHGNHKDLKNIYFDSLHFILIQAIFFDLCQNLDPHQFYGPMPPKQKFWPMPPMPFFWPTPKFYGPMPPMPKFKPTPKYCRPTPPMPPKPKFDPCHPWTHPCHPQYLADSFRVVLYLSLREIIFFKLWITIYGL